MVALIYFHHMKITPLFGFLKFYVMGSIGFDFGGIAHVKVWVIAHQKM